LLTPASSEIPHDGVHKTEPCQHRDERALAAFFFPHTDDSPLARASLNECTALFAHDPTLLVGFGFRLSEIRLSRPAASSDLMGGATRLCRGVLWSVPARGRWKCPTATTALHSEESIFGFVSPTKKPVRSGSRLRSCNHGGGGTMARPTIPDTWLKPNNRPDHPRIESA